MFARTVEPPLKETPNKGQDLEHQNVLRPSFPIVLTHLRKEPLYNEQNNLSQKLRYSEVPLYAYKIHTLDHTLALVEWSGNYRRSAKPRRGLSSKGAR